MSIEIEINKLSSNRVDIPNKESYSVILGLNPSKGARSPVLWNYAYEHFSINSKMIPIDVNEKNFEKLLAVLQQDQAFSGGAIAAPHKEAAAAYIGSNVTKEAQSIGAINCLFRNTDGALCGTNTDGDGSLIAFENIFGKTRDKLILILGAGGTGKAVSAYFAAAAHDLEKFFIASRSNAAIKLSSDLGCNAISWSSINEILPKVDILINCTSLGSITEPSQSPISINDLKQLQSDAIVYDVIYDPNPTQLLKDADLLGHRTLNGGDMNFEQAVIGFHYAATKGALDLNNLDIRNAMKQSGA